MQGKLLGCLAAVLLSGGSAQAQAGLAPGDLTRAEFIKTMDGEFRKRDLDGDHVITRAELEAYNRNVAMAEAQSANARLFRQLDVNADGQLSAGEFAALARDPGFIDVSAEMGRFDANRDTKITPIEYRGATLANFDKLDADKDGIVTVAEMKAGNMQPAER